MSNAENRGDQQAGRVTRITMTTGLAEDASGVEHRITVEYEGSGHRRRARYVVGGGRLTVCGIPTPSDPLAYLLCTVVVLVWGLVSSTAGVMSAVAAFVATVGGVVGWVRRGRILVADDVQARHVLYAADDVVKLLAHDPSNPVVGRFVSALEHGDAVNVDAAGRDPRMALSRPPDRAGQGGRYWPGRGGCGAPVA